MDSQIADLLGLLELETLEVNLFRGESREDKDRFEQLTGKPVAGFRAPRFSLIAATRR